MERYVTNRDKTIGRLRKTFEKLLKEERALDGARDPRKIVKGLQATAKPARIIYGTFYNKPEKLEQNYPGPISRDALLADLASDDIFEYMGLKTPSGYIKGSKAYDMESSASYGDWGEKTYLWRGLDSWKPFWPGWKGTIHYPEGSTGRDENRTKW